MPIAPQPEGTDATATADNAGATKDTWERGVACLGIRCLERAPPIRAPEMI